MDDKDIGKKLKNLRQMRGISLRSLAGVSGVTLGAVSQIENGKSSPSISTMKKLLTALGTTMGDFFAEEQHAPSQFVFPEAEQAVIDTGKGIRYRTIPGSSEGRLIQLLYAEYDPGAGTGPDKMTHEGEECGFCIQGTAEFTVDGVTERIGAGDAYYFKSTVPHSFKNTGKRKARFFSAGTPPTF